MTKQGKEVVIIQPPTWEQQGYISARYFVAIMSFLGMTFDCMFRSNINLTIIAMVKPSNKSANLTWDINPCHFEEQIGDANEFNGDLEWNEFTQGLILGSFYWGYIWLQIPGGRIAEIIGPRKVYGCAVLASAIINLFIPMASHANPTAVIVLRVLMGLCQGPTFPSAHEILANWAPIQERSLMSSIIYAGVPAGTIFAFQMAACIINSFGWEFVFYIQALVGIVWSIAWFLMVTDKPKDFKWISESEKEFLKKTISPLKNDKVIPVPWKSMLTSVPFLSILIAAFGNNWGLFTLTADLPLYMKNMLRTSISKNANYSSLPYLGMLLFSFIVSPVGDFLTRRKILSIIWVRKFATLIAHGGPAICLLSLALVECNRPWTITLLFLSITLWGAGPTGWLINPVDIAPNFAGTLWGISNGISSIPGWVCPTLVGYLTNNNQTFDAWRKVFFIAGGIYVFDVVFFLIFSSGEVQKWNFYEDENSDTSENVDSKSEDIFTLKVVPHKTSHL